MRKFVTVVVFAFLVLQMQMDVLCWLDDGAGVCRW